MRSLVVGAAMAVAALAGPVRAGDWTGPYIGVGVGQTDFDGPGALDGDDVSYGIHGGYDYDFGDFVLGGELEYDRSDITLGGGLGQLDNIGRLKLRFGYDFGPALGYVVAGRARANTSTGDDTGAVYGLGMAYAISDQLTLGGEYLYHDFNDFNGTGLDAKADTLNVRASFRF